MAKGIKMDSAKKKDCGNEVFNISKLSKADNGNLICKYCRAEVQYVSAHTRHASNTPVSAYFKLWQDAEHIDGCGYSVKGAVEQLVADSNAVEDTVPIFEPLENGTYLFRMNILIDAQKTAQKLVESGDDFNNSKHLSIRRKYIRTEQQLASYFRSAAGIAKLRALIQESQDVEQLTKLIKIQYKDSYVSWNDFYYDETRYQILFNRLNKNRVTHPVAVNLTVKGDLNYFKKAKYFPWSYQCYSQTVKKNESTLVFIPKLHLAKEKYSKNISAKDTLLVVGSAWANKPKDESSVFRNINISAFNISQIKKEVDAQ